MERVLDEGVVNEEDRDGAIAEVGDDRIPVPGIPVHVTREHDDDDAVEVAEQPPAMLRQATVEHETAACNFCDEAVSIGGRRDIRLGCRCLVHIDCLTKYIRHKMEDVGLLRTQMQRGGDGRALLPHEIGIVCPFFSRAVLLNQCQKSNGERYIINLEDMQQLFLLSSEFLLTGSSESTQYFTEDMPPLSRREIERMRILLNAPIATAAAAGEGGGEEAPPSSTDALLEATTILCPKCGVMRFTRYHSHGCHAG